MKILNLAVVFEEDENRLAQDIFFGRTKSMLIPDELPYADMDFEEFLLVTKGPMPGVALVMTSNLAHLSLEDVRDHAEALGLRDYSRIIRREIEEDADLKRTVTVVNIKNVQILPMDMLELVHSNYLNGTLMEEGETEG